MKVSALGSVLLLLLFLGCTQPPPDLPPIPEIAKTAYPNVPIGISQNSSNLSVSNFSASNISVGPVVLPEQVPIPAPMPDARDSNASNASFNDSIEILKNLSWVNASLPDESRNVTGLVFGAGQYLLALDDIVLDSSKPGGSCAAISIYDIETSVLVGREKVCSDYDQAWISPSGRVFRIRLIKAVAGYTHEANWAEFRIFG